MSDAVCDDVMEPEGVSDAVIDEEAVEVCVGTAVSEELDVAPGEMEPEGEGVTVPVLLAEDEGVAVPLAVVDGEGCRKGRRKTENEHIQR